MKFSLRAELVKAPVCAAVILPCCRCLYCLVFYVLPLCMVNKVNMYIKLYTNSVDQSIRVYSKVTQATWSRYINVIRTDGQTDGRLTIAIARFALHAARVKIRTNQQ